MYNENHSLGEWFSYRKNTVEVISIFSFWAAFIILVSWSSVLPDKIKNNGWENHETT